jgi:hypothetical protein
MGTKHQTLVWHKEMVKETEESTLEKRRKNNGTPAMLNGLSE